MSYVHIHTYFRIKFGGTKRVNINPFDNPSFRSTVNCESSTLGVKGTPCGQTSQISAN
jgi:hypothetical protein